MWKRKENFLFDIELKQNWRVTEEWGLAPNGDCTDLSTDPYQPLSATLNSKMADEGAIPLVDFSVVGLNCANPPSQDDESVKLLAEKIHTAFSTIGFVYLSNHGISDEEASLL